MESKLTVEISAKIDELQKAFLAAGASVSNFAGKTDTILGKLANDLNVAQGYFQLFGDKAQKNVSQLNAYNVALRSLLEQGFRPTSKEVLTVTANIDRLNKMINANAGRGGLSGYAKGSNEAAFALQNLGRVAQDVPFGFIGIQNNLNPLLESFGRLRQETGSNAKALSALGSSLIGPAGIGIALSLVSSAILLYNEYQRKAQIETDKLAGKTENYADTLDDVRQSQLKGSQAAQSDLTNLKLLFTAYTNATVPLNDRKEAYDQLQKLYPAYFENIKFEKEASDKTRDAYNQLTTAIIATARARAASDLIAKNSSRKLEDEQKIVDLQVTETELLGREASLRERIKNAQGNAVVGLARDLATVEGQITENKKLQRDLATDINILDKNNLQLVKSINKEVAAGGKITGQVGDVDPKTKEKKKKLKILPTKEELEDERAQLIINIKQAILDYDYSGVFNQAKEAVKDGLTEGKPLIPFTAILPENMAKNVAQELKLINYELIEFSKSAADIVNNSITGTFDSLGNAIGTALATGANAFEAGGKALLGSFGGFLTEYGKLLIKYGAAAVLKGKLDLAALIPGAGIPAGIAAIAAGVALVAAGAAIGNFASGNNNSSEGVTRPRKIPGFANGVRDFTGGLAVVGERGPELVNLPTGSSVIPNHNLSSFGGGDIVFNVSSRIDQLGNLITAIDRERSRLRRVGA